MHPCACVCPCVCVGGGGGGGGTGGLVVGTPVYNTSGSEICMSPTSADVFHYITSLPSAPSCKMGTYRSLYIKLGWTKPLIVVIITS